MRPQIPSAAKYALIAALSAAGMYWFKARRAARGVGQGATSRARSLIRSSDVSDDVLVERVRVAVGRATSHAGEIDVSCSQGVITLRGAVLKHEHPRVMRAARSAGGASELHDELAAYKRPGRGKSSLQRQGTIASP
ncbi:hypothetical protein GCM10011487_69440 [Steroidobacter agaridevorans]|uniref:BON domain-containing protein n=1 Tax=Steroidobacter agaridevorans TaxID=2695856 RepID=A0A829YNA3_9GAMM|nr:BON domain-containing protein [Steroidobacter agaridevorans]GFE84944.1 hypothetical protein GCM10011487_69440 [Steroidobacter agaridevorans]